MSAFNPLRKDDYILGKYDLGSKNAGRPVGVRMCTRSSYVLVWDELLLDLKSDIYLNRRSHRAQGRSHPATCAARHRILEFSAEQRVPMPTHSHAQLHRMPYRVCAFTYNNVRVRHWRQVGAPRYSAQQRLLLIRALLRSHAA